VTRRARVLLSGAAALAFLSACASSDIAELQSQPNYGRGYGDGCQTAQEARRSFSTKQVRDDYLFDNDEAYAAGWRQGYISCGDRPALKDPRAGAVYGERDDAFSR